MRPLVDSPDTLPVPAARRGDPEAWTVIFRRYQLPLYSYVADLTRDPASAFDLVQEVFVRAVRHLPSLREDERLGSWLFGIAHQQVLQFWRRARRQPFMDGEIPEDYPTPDAEPGVDLVWNEDPRPATILPGRGSMGRLRRPPAHPQPLPSSHHTMNATSVLSRRARVVRWISLLTLAAAVAVFLLYGIENLRGWSEWKSQRDALLAQGRQLRPADFFPPSVPDSENFALIPPLQPLFDFDLSPTATNRWRDPDAFNRTLDLFNLPGARRGSPEPWPSDGSGRWQRGIPLDLARFQAAFAQPPAAPDPSALQRRYGLVPPVGSTPPPTPPDVARIPAAPGPEAVPYLPPTPGTPAQDILYVLNHLKSDFQAIEEGLRLPHSRFPIQYGQGYSTLLPHLAVLKKFCLRFRLRGIARLAEGDTNGALRDIESMLRLADSSQVEPFLISHLVRAACLQYAIHTAWEGVIRHAWTEPQLSQLQARFAGYDLLPDIRRCLQVEQAGLIELVEGLIASAAERRKYLDLFAAVSDGSPVSGADMAQLEWYLRLAPRGWLYASLAASIRALETLIAFDPAHPEAVPAAWRAALDAKPPSLRLLLHHRFVLREGARERFDRSVINLVRTHTSLHIAAHAAALERHRLAHGGYPARLEDIDPRFQVPPRSSTQPLRYRPEARDRFRLWTDGDDGRNDDGAWPEPISPGGSSFGEPMQQGDWVWRWPDSETP